MNSKRIAILVDQPPRALIAVREEADVALAALALEQEVSVVFVGNGVYHCCRPEPRPEHDPSAVYGSFELYDVERLLVDEESLERRGLAATGLRFGVEPISRRALGALLRDADLIL